MTLPGDLPGLLWECSPVRRRSDGWLGRVWDLHPGTAAAHVCWPLAKFTTERLDGLALYLTDPTGRVHAAWWAMSGGRNAWPRSHEERVSLDMAMRGWHMTDDEIATLRDLCLRLAGRVTDE